MNQLIDIHLSIGDLSKWILWTIKKEKQKQEDEKIWELYLHTGALYGKSFKEWKEDVLNGG